MNGGYEKKNQKKQIIRVLSESVQKIIEQERMDFSELQEIRLRIGQPVTVLYQNEELILPTMYSEKKRLGKQEMKETIEHISNYSLYAYEHELKQGFITIEGGHRVGMAGQVIMEGGKIKNMKYISSINIRVSHEVLDCANKIFPYITYNKQMYHTLIISPPRCGKTTLLRDVIRQISDGNRWIKGCTVGVVDERSELGGCYLGVIQNNLGMRTDILDRCPKADGMIMLIRSMAPQVVAVDEIGAKEDVHAIEYAMHCGCKNVGDSTWGFYGEICKKPILKMIGKKDLSAMSS